MPKGSIIGTRHEVELVTPDVRAPLSFVVENIVLSYPAMCCLAAGMLVGA